ncbi:hypothetical protein HC928_05995 [bacterium]|nr:hypothetical protein [bacterium]
MRLKAKKSNRERDEKTQAIEEATREDTKRLNAEIPTRLHSKVKIQAAREQRTVTQIVIEALNDYLSKNSNE